LKYANSTHSLRALLELSEGEQESKRGRITKFSTMIHLTFGVELLLVEGTGDNGCRYLLQALWEKTDSTIKKPVRNDELVARTAEKLELLIRGFG
jgi:hypothetical protein